jgi:hypothetical protein
MSEVDTAVRGGDCFICALPVVLKVKWGDCGIYALVAQQLVGDMCLLKYFQSPLWVSSRWPMSFIISVKNIGAE